MPQSWNMPLEPEWCFLIAVHAAGRNVLSNFISKMDIARLSFVTVTVTTAKYI